MNMAFSMLDNSPNAQKLLESLRYLGYDNLLAISDIVDNSIDAEADKIHINILRAENGGFVIQIADNGMGMTEKVLDQASRLGSQTPRSPTTDLGRFGMGLVTAAWSLGRRLTIITRCAGGELLSNVTDIDHMIHSNRFVREYFGLARKEESQLFHELLDDPNDAPNGTIVQISNTDGFRRRYTKVFEKELARHLGQVYRMFIRSNRHFFVNGNEVAINDPLWLDQGAEIYSDETYNLKYTVAGSQEQEEPIRIRLVILPDHGSRELNAKAGYKVERSGFYILRNNREIAEAQLLGLLSRHPDYIRFRGEIFINGRLDEAFGIEFTKRDIKLIQSIRDQLEDFVGANIRSIRNRLKKQIVVRESEAIDHSSAEKLINSKASLLIKPPANLGGNQVRRTQGVSDQLEGDADKGKANQTALGAVKFRTGRFDKEGPIYVAEQQGRTTFIDWNIDHPFYERFVLANRNNNEAFNAVDAMIFSIAVAELKTFDEDQQHLFDNWKTTFSMNLRILLS